MPEQNDTAMESSKIRLLATILLVGLIVVHATKALGFFPIIIPDEYTYISDIRHRAYPDALVPNYLFYAVYSLTGLFGKAFLDAGRVMNAFFFMLAIPFVYATAKSVCGGGKTAFIVALVTAVSPISSYTAFFMPESLYFAVFWAMTWFFVARGDAPAGTRYFALMGAFIGGLALVKTHGIFLLPGMTLFVLAQTPRATPREYFRRSAQSIAFGFAAFAAVRIGLGCLFAGPAGLNLLGGEYTGLAEEGRAALTVFSLLPKILYNMIGHLLGLALVVGIPIVFVVLRLARPTPSGTPEARRLRRMAIYGFSFLVPLLCITACFSGMLDELFPSEFIREASRIQWRYYNFILPLFLILGAGALTQNAPADPAAWRGKWLFLLPAAAATYIGATTFGGYIPATLPDCPELGPFLIFPLLCKIYSAGYGALSLSAIYRPTRAIRTYLFVFAPLSALILSGAAQYESMYANGIFPNLYDKAGLFARQYLGEECRDLTVVDGFLNHGKKALIHIDNAETDLVVQLEGPIDMSRIRPGKNWMLLMGERSFPKSYDKFSIVYIDPAQTDDLTQLMRSSGTTRYMLKYSLIRLTSFDFSADLAGKNNWPVANVHRNGATAAVEYRIPLSGSHTVSIEPDPGTTAGRYEIGAVNQDGTFVAVTTLENGQNATLTIPNNENATGILLRRVDAPDLGVRRLIITSRK